MAEIKSPNTSYNGEIGGVQFVGGTANTDDQRMIDWFKRRGYIVGGKKQTTHPASDPVQVEGESSPVKVGNDQPDEKLDGAGTQDESNATVNTGTPPKLDTDSAGASGTTATEQKEGEHVPQPQADYDDLNKDQLKEILREKDLPVGGSKDELLARVKEAQNG